VLGKAYLPALRDRMMVEEVEVRRWV